MAAARTCGFKSCEKRGFTTQNIWNGVLQATEIMVISLQ